MAYLDKHLYSWQHLNNYRVALFALASCAILSLNNAVGQVIDVSDNVEPMLSDNSVVVPAGEATPMVATEEMPLMMDTENKEDEGEDWGNPEGCPIETPGPGATCSIEKLSCEWGKECCEFPINEDDCSSLETVCSSSFKCSCSNGSWLCLYTDACMYQPCSTWAIEMERKEKLKEEVCGQPTDECMDTENWIECNMGFANCEDFGRISPDGECPKRFGCPNDNRQGQPFPEGTKMMAAIKNATIATENTTGIVPTVEDGTKVAMDDATVANGNIMGGIMVGSPGGIMVGSPSDTEETISNNQEENDNAFKCLKPDGPCSDQETYDMCLKLISDGCTDIVETRSCPPKLFCMDKNQIRAKEGTDLGNTAAAVSAAHHQNYCFKQYLSLLLPSLSVILWSTMI